MGTRFRDSGTCRYRESVRLVAEALGGGRTAKQRFRVLRDHRDSPARKRIDDEAGSKVRRLHTVHACSLHWTLGTQTFQHRAALSGLPVTDPVRHMNSIRLRWVWRQWQRVLDPARFEPFRDLSASSEHRGGLGCCERAKRLGQPNPRSSRARSGILFETHRHTAAEVFGSLRGKQGTGESRTARSLEPAAESRSESSTLRTYAPLPADIPVARPPERKPRWRRVPLPSITTTPPSLILRRIGVIGVRHDRLWLLDQGRHVANRVAVG